MAALICFRVSKAASKLHMVLKTAFGSSAIVSAQTFDWFSWCKCGVTSVEDCELSGYTSSGHTGKNVVKVCKIINKDH